MEEFFNMYSTDKEKLQEKLQEINAICEMCNNANFDDIVESRKYLNYFVNYTVWGADNNVVHAMILIAIRISDFSKLSSETLMMLKRAIHYHKHSDQQQYDSTRINATSNIENFLTSIHFNNYDRLYPIWTKIDVKNYVDECLSILIEKL